jgi:hypothetical protein
MSLKPAIGSKDPSVASCKRYVVVSMTIAAMIE